MLMSSRSGGLPKHADNWANDYALENHEVDDMRQYNNGGYIGYEPVPC
jgi:hypothetical protein